MKKSLIAPASTAVFKLRAAALGLSACATLFFLAAPSHAGSKPGNLGPGLDSLVEANLKVKAARRNHTEGSLKLYNGFATKKAANIAGLRIKDESGRVLVRVQPNGLVPIGQLVQKAKADVPTLKVQAIDRTFHNVGAFEAFIPVDDVTKLSGMMGVSSVLLTPKPIHAGARRWAAAQMARAQAEAAQIAVAQMGAANGEPLNIIGTVFDFGITQHRVDQINQTYNPSALLDYEGGPSATFTSGKTISVGDLSDSFDTSSSATSTTSPHSYATDVASGDLPGTGNPVNTQPVVVLQDYPSGTDEGRGMIQTIYKMAPKARLAFATADSSEIGFANNIRALAGLPGFTYSSDVQQGFKADVICDDVSYIDEPFFQDGIIAQGVNDVVKAGVSYFSSAANNSGTNGYDADFNFVSAASVVTGGAVPTITLPSGLTLQLTGVPTDAYAGGFQNFAAKGQPVNVGQSVNFPTAATAALYTEVDIPGVLPGGIPVVLQWNDPDGSNAVTLAPGQQPVYTLTNDTTGANAATSALPEQGDTTNEMTEVLNPGQEYYLVLTPSSSPTIPGTNALDGQIEIYDSNGNELSFTDNNGSGQPETVLFVPPSSSPSNTYTVRVTAFQEAAAMDVTDGTYTLQTYAVSGTPQVTESLNLLVFDATTGAYMSQDSVTTNSIASNSPIKFTEFINESSSSQLIFVISRATEQPAADGRTANHFRYLCFGDGIVPLGPAVDFSYTTPLTFGHSAAAGANSVAAYPYYKPNIPEFFTSPGPVTVYFDQNNNYIGPTVRLKPDIAAMDGANTTFFGSDDDQDEDSNDNFFGTSDACPHAGAIAALVLDANGGPGSVTPAQMKSVLRRSAFPHDLDPYYARGSARTAEGGQVIVTLRGDNEDAQTAYATAAQNGTTGVLDANAFTVQYIGPGSLASLVFNPTGSANTSGNTTDGQNGIDDATPYKYFQTSTPGLTFSQSAAAGGFAFTLGTSSANLTYPVGGLGGTVQVAQSNANGNAGTVDTTSNFTLTLTFNAGTFTGGEILRFGIGREEYNSANVATSGNPPASSAETVPNGSADLFGGGVSLPDGTKNTQGMTFSGATADGSAFSGVILNRIGAGYSVVDGFGFIDAEAAVTAPLN